MSALPCLNTLASARLAPTQVPVFHGLVQVSGLFDQLQHLKPRHTTEEELAR